MKKLLEPQALQRYIQFLLDERNRQVPKLQSRQLVRRAVRHVKLGGFLADRKLEALMEFRIRAGNGFGGLSVIRHDARRALQTVRQFQQDAEETIIVLTLDGRKVALDELEQLAREEYGTNVPAF